MSDSERSEVSMESEDAAEPEREDRNSTLFTDDRESFNARSSKTTRKLPKGLSVELLKQAAVGSRQLLVQMSNHPRCESFLEDAYVRCRTSNVVTLAQVRKLKPVTPYSVGTEKCSVAFIVRRLVAGPHSTEAEEETLTACDVVDEELTPNESSQFMRLLERLPRGGSGYMRLEALPVLLQGKAKQLAEFTFTENDVEEMLKTRKADVSSKDLYILKADLELELESLRNQKTGKKHANRQRLAQIGQDLLDIDAKMGMSRKRAPQTDLISRMKKPTIISSPSPNPYSRRECRPTVMWATTENRTPDTKPKTAVAATPELGVLPIEVQQNFTSDVIAWRAAISRRHAELLELTQ